MGLKEKLLKIKYIRAAKMIGSVCSLSSEKKLGEGLAGTHVVTYAEVWFGYGRGGGGVFNNLLLTLKELCKNVLKMQIVWGIGIKAK